MPQLRLLFLLLLQDCRSVGDLADEMNVRPATITGLTDRLVRQELIERQADASDRRLVRIALTDEGRRLIAEIETAARALLDGIFRRMSEDEVRRLIDAFEQFGAAADELQQERETQP